MEFNGNFTWTEDGTTLEEEDVKEKITTGGSPCKTV